MYIKAVKSNSVGTHKHILKYGVQLRAFLLRNTRIFSVIYCRRLLTYSLVYF